ncbi:MAG: class I tRNA ligase family protein [Phycisphaerales bacterium]
MSSTAPATSDPIAELPRKYVPSEHEPVVRDRWDRSGAFHADPNAVLAGEGKPYCILIPPPNVTARLHLGHALNNSLQDILVRAHRMKGYQTLWMPGTDHAGIATQTVVDKRLQAEGQPALKDYKLREAEGEPGRDEFVAKVQEWKDEYEAVITDQLKMMGCSCDWDRQRFTMDDICARAVREAFFQLFKDGLIYRGKRLVNWDPVTQTALSDDEVEMHEVDGNFYYMHYPLVDDSGAYITVDALRDRGYPADHLPEPVSLDGTDNVACVTVATTRPETYFGDTSVAINPADPRAESLRGLRVQLPIVGRIIPIVEDDYVVMPDFITGEDSGDPKAQMATGFLKVTPAHDPNDWEIGQRHGLEVINVMAPDASISTTHGWEDLGAAQDFIGMPREDARIEVKKRFKQLGLLGEVKPYRHSVGHSYRSHAAIEPYLSDQWYCKVTDDKLRGYANRAHPRPALHRHVACAVWHRRRR